MPARVHAEMIDPQACWLNSRHAKDEHCKHFHICMLIHFLSSIHSETRLCSWEQEMRTFGLDVVPLLLISFPMPTVLLRKSHSFILLLRIPFLCSFFHMSLNFSLILTMHTVVQEGSEPDKFWKLIGGKQPYLCHSLTYCR